MRRHPLVGAFFLLLGAALLLMGAFSRGGPAFLDHLPLPPEIVVPFILWQLAVWSVLFGLFFLRTRSRWEARRSIRAA